MRKLAVCMVFSIIVIFAQVAVASIIAKPAVDRIRPDGELSEASWEAADWLLIPHTALVNKDYLGTYASDREAAMLVAVIHDNNYVYLGAKVVMERMSFFPQTTIEFWLDRLHVYVGRNVLGEPVFQTVIIQGETVDTTPPQRARSMLVKTSDLDPDNQYGLKGVAGYTVEIAISRSDLAKMLGIQVTSGATVPFAAGYKMPIEGADLNAGLLYYPDSYVDNQVETFGELKFQ